MNGIDKITARLETEARQDAQRVLAEAQANCESIRADYDKQAQAKYWEAVRAGVKTCEQRVQRLGKTAEMESKKSVLSLKQEMVGRAFSRAEELLCALPEDRYLAFLAGQAAEASSSGGESVILNAADRAKYGQRAVDAANKLLRDKGRRAALTLSAESRDFSGGLMLKDGDVEVNCTVASLVDYTRAEMSAQVADALFA